MTPPLSSESRPFVSLRWAVGGILLLGIVSRLIGLAREVLIAGLFGTSDQLDAVLLGLALPIALCLGAGGGIGRSIVPVAASLDDRLSGGLFKWAWKSVGRYVLLAAGTLAVTSYFWTRPLAPPEWELSQRLIVWASAALGSLALFGAFFGGLSKGLANAHGRHVSSAALPIVYNATVITSILLFGRSLGAFSLAVGIAAAEFLQTLPLVPFLNRVTTRIRIPARALRRQVSSTLPPAIFLAMSMGLMGAVDRFFAATLPEGSVSSLAYAERLLYLPAMMLGMALQQPLFTRLSRFAATGNKRAFSLTLELGVRFLLLMGAPTIILFAGFTEPLIAVLLERGAFAAEDTARTAVALRGYSVAIVFHSILPLLMGAGLAAGKAWPIATLYMLNILLNALLDALLVEPFGLLGIAMATSIISAVTAWAMTLVIMPELLWRRGLWRTAVVSAALIIAGLAIVVLIREAAGIRGGGLAGNLIYLATWGLVTAAAMLALFGRNAWNEYRRLRHLTAKAGRHLRPRKKKK